MRCVLKEKRGGNQAFAMAEIQFATAAVGDGAKPYGTKVEVA